MRIILAIPKRSKDPLPLDLAFPGRPVPIRMTVHISEMHMRQPIACIPDKVIHRRRPRHASCAWPVSTESAIASDPKLSTISRRVAGSTSWILDVFDH